MNKVKICPYCGMHNSPVNFECDQCGTDLMYVCITDLDVVETQSETPAPSAPAETVTPELVRICEDCGTENLPAIRKCSKCGEDISDVIPTPSSSCTQKKTAVLETEDGYTYPICEDSTVTVGRDTQMAEYLNSRGFVSRCHAELSFHDGALWVKDLGSMNHTFVNGEQVVSEPVCLAEGDLLSLGGKQINDICQPQAAYFTVRYQ